MKKFLSLLPAVLFSIGAQAGGVTSGGGYGVLCYTNSQHTQLKSIQLLDFYKAEIGTMNWKLRELPDGKDVFEKAKNVIKRIEAFSPQLAREWSQNIDDFRDGKMKFIIRGSIQDIDDGETPVSPDKNCIKKQMAVQFKDPGEFEHSLLVDENIWTQMDELTKVGLLVHESIYRTAMQQNHENANKVHYLTGILFSEYTRTMTPDKYLKVFQDAKIDGCFVKEMNFTSGDPEAAPVSYPLSYEISSYNIKQNSGIICDEAFVPGFAQSSNGFLRVFPGFRVTESEQEFCIANPTPEADESIFLINRTSYYQKVCFGRQTEAGVSPVTRSYNSSLPISMTEIPGIAVASCLDQKMENNEVIACEVLSASVNLNGTSFPLQKFAHSFGVDYYQFKNVRKSTSLLIDGQMVSVLNTFTVFSDGSIYLAPASREQVLKFKGQECQFDRQDVLEFNSSGEFVRVFHRSSPELNDFPYHQNRCSKLYE